MDIIFNFNNFNNFNNFIFSVIFHYIYILPFDIYIFYELFLNSYNKYINLMNNKIHDDENILFKIY